MANDHNPGQDGNIHGFEAPASNPRHQENPGHPGSATGEVDTSTLPDPARRVGLSLGIAALVLSLAAGIYFLKNHKRGVSQAELDRLTQEFPPAIAKVLAEKRQGSHLNRLEITRKEVDAEGAVHFTYLLSFDETTPGGESTTNTLNQVAVLKRNGKSWSVTAIDPQSQELSFHTELAIESEVPPPGARGGAAPASAPDR